MASKEISTLTAGGALTGSDQVHALSGGNSRRFYIPAWHLLGGSYTSAGIWDQSVDGNALNVDFAGLAGADDILILARNVTKSVSGTLNMRVSIDNGSTFYNSSGNYVSLANTGVETNAASAGLHDTSTTAARSCIGMIYGASASGTIKRISSPIRTEDLIEKLFVASTSPIDAVRVYPSGGGNLTGGIIYCLARGKETT